MEIVELQNKVNELLNTKLKGFFIDTKIRKQFFGNVQYLQITIATSDKEINNVSGQYTDCISMMLTENMELSFQVFGGMGGQTVYRKIDPNNPDEKYNALGVEKIPFRTPKTNETAVFKALEGVCKKYVETLKQIKERNLLAYTNLVDYDNLLK